MTVSLCQALLLLHLGGKAMWRGQKGKVSTEEDGLRDPSGVTSPTEISEQKLRVYIVPGSEKHVSGRGTTGDGAVLWT